MDRPAGSGAATVDAAGMTGDPRIGGAGYRTAVRLSWLALVNIGAYTALLGPVLPELAERTGLGLGAVGASSPSSMPSPASSVPSPTPRRPPLAPNNTVALW